MQDGQRVGCPSTSRRVREGSTAREFDCARARTRLVNPRATMARCFDWLSAWRAELSPLPAKPTSICACRHCSMPMATATRAFAFAATAVISSLHATYDSADNDDPKDGKSQFGYLIMLFDGLIDAVSKQTPHVGTSSTHNEYIAMAEPLDCCKLSRAVPASGVTMETLQLRFYIAISYLTR